MITLALTLTLFLHASFPISLAGQWQFALDPHGVGAA